MEITLLILIVLTATTLYVTRWVPMEVTSLLVIVSLPILGLLTPEQAFSGFSSSATLTVGAMFVLSGGLIRTGALENITFYLARYSQGSPLRLLAMVALVVPLASAFMNNTPVVVMMVPVILSLARQFGTSPSKLLMPVSYFAILGGTLTLIGTSTNILVDSIYRSAGGPGFSLFDFAPMGLLYAAVGTAYIMLFSQRLLPNNEVMDLTQQRQTAYVAELVISDQSDLISRRAGDVVDRVVRSMPPPPSQRVVTGKRRVQRLPHTGEGQEQDQMGLSLLALYRGGQQFVGSQAANQTLQAGDTLLVAGSPKAIKHFADSRTVYLNTVLADNRRIVVDTPDQYVVEAVVLPESSCVGTPVGKLGLYSRFGIAVMGVQRSGRHQMRGLRSLRLSSGDVLLLQGSQHELSRLSEEVKLMLVEGVNRTILHPAKNRQALLIMLMVILLATFSPIPMSVLAMAGAALMMITRCLSAEDALRSLDAPTLMLLAGTIPLGLAMESTGLAGLVVDGIIRVTGDASPYLFLSLFYLLTSILTELISNNAVAVLLTPIALQMSATLGIAPEPLLVAISFGASASFVTPMGYQTNAIVMGPGNYLFKDYMRFGLPLALTMWITASIVIPILWPL